MSGDHWFHGYGSIVFMVLITLLFDYIYTLPWSENSALGLIFQGGKSLIAVNFKQALFYYSTD